MLDLFRHLRIHTQKKPKEEPEEMDFPEMYLMGLGATTELPENFEECDYEYDYLDDEAVRVTVYCGDPPPEEEEEPEGEEELPDEGVDPESEEESPDEQEEPETGGEEDTEDLSNSEEDE